MQFTLQVWINSSMLPDCHVCYLSYLKAMFVMYPTCIGHVCYVSYLTALFVMYPTCRPCFLCILPDCHVCYVSYLTAMFVMYSTDCHVCYLSYLKAMFFMFPTWLPCLLCILPDCHVCYVPYLKAMFVMYMFVLCHKRFVLNKIYQYHLNTGFNKLLSKYLFLIVYNEIFGKLLFNEYIIDKFTFQ